jgi:DNA-binding transcriptional MerR regulator
MSDRTYAIGELSRLSGVPVRRLRFYSDQGLLPPTARTESGYRMYSAADLARLDLILALRDAGAGLDEIRRTLSRPFALADVLRLRLQAIEAEIRSKRRIAASLRAALRAPDPTHHDLRRLWAVTSLSQTDFRAAVEPLLDQAAGDTEIDPDWKKQMVDAGTPELPDDPTPEQIDAWTELMAMLSDQDYLREMRVGMAEMWNGDFDPAAYAAASNAIFERIRVAIGQGLPPDSAAGRSIAQDWLEGSAKAMNRSPDAAFLDWHAQQYRKHHARSTRYQELMAILQGGDPSTAAGHEWRWIHEAMAHHL